MNNLAGKFFHLLRKVAEVTGYPPSALPALAPVTGHVTARQTQWRNYDLRRIVKDLQVLLGVPKFRTPQRQCYSK